VVQQSNAPNAKMTPEEHRGQAQEGGRAWVHAKIGCTVTSQAPEAGSMLHVQAMGKSGCCLRRPWVRVGACASRESQWVLRVQAMGQDE